MKKYVITKPDPFFGISIAEVSDNGDLIWLGQKENDSSYISWLAEGNVPEEWNPDAN